MSDHAIRWTYDHGGINAEAICTAAPDADCHLTSVTCECEVWGRIWRRDDGTIWHHIYDYGESIEPVWHQVEIGEDCNIALSINAGGYPVELGPTTSFVVAETPIDAVCDVDEVTWKPTAPPSSSPAPVAPGADTEAGERDA